MILLIFILQMNASGMIIPSENSTTDSNDSNGAHNSSVLSLSSFTNFNMPSLGGSTRLLRSILSFPRPLSPIASSPSTTPPHTPDGSPRQCPPNSTTPTGVNSSWHSHQSHSGRSSRRATPTSSPSSPKPASSLSNHSCNSNSNCASPIRPNLLNIEGAHGYLGPHNNQATPTPSPMDMKPIYEAESPDELALVDAANKYGCRLLRRTIHDILVTLPGEFFVFFF